MADLVVKIYTPFVWFHLKMNDLDTSNDAKNLVGEMVGCDPSSFALKHGKPDLTMPSDDTLLGDLSYQGVVKLFLSSSSPDVPKKLIALREIQNKARDDKRVLSQDGLTFSAEFVSFTSHNLQETTVDATFKDEMPVSVPASDAPASSTSGGGGKADMKSLKQRMADLEAENVDMKYRMKQNTMEIRELLKRCRAMDINIELLRPSGETFVVKGCPADTVSKFKKLVQAEFGFPYLHQRLIKNNTDGAPMELVNNRKLYSYGLENDGDQVQFLITGGEVIATPAQAVAHQSSSEDELEIGGTPPMSDDDAFQPPTKRRRHAHGAGQGLCQPCCDDVW